MDWDDLRFLAGAFIALAIAGFVITVAIVGALVFASWLFGVPLK